MENQNPWRQFPHDTYEKHMGHENVRQLEMLSHIFGEQLAVVADVSAPTLAVLGITGSNGLENIEAGRYKAVIGIDINGEYLRICRERYGWLPELELHQLDLMTEKDRAVNILKHSDLITANLLVKHIHLENFVDIVGKLEKPIVSITIQYNPDGSIISQSGYEAAFEDIVEHGENSDESALDIAMCNLGYEQICRTEYELPNEKIFIRLDYKRQNIAIRLAVPADAPDMAEIHMRSWEAAYKDIIPAEYIREKNAGRLEQWKRILTEMKYPQYVIQKNGKPDGIMCIASPQDDDLADDFYELHGIYLHSNYYRQGIGTQAMEFAFDTARNANKKFMTVWVFEDNINSVKFYEKCGFVPDGKTKILNFGKPLTAIRMRREL